MVDIVALRRDLADEQESLDELVVSLDESGWDTATPAHPWSVRDQIAHLGVLARRHSYETNGMTAPSEPVFVELTGPGGDKWVWGDPGEQRVEGPAVDFCLVVTRRRNVADTDLITHGRAAREW